MAAEEHDHDRDHGDRDERDRKESQGALGQRRRTSVAWPVRCVLVIWGGGHPAGRYLPAPPTWWLPLRQNGDRSEEAR
jgi:hypothetical protein